MNATVNKGDRVRARWFEAAPKASLAGVQFKVSATEREITGRIRRIRGDRPVDPQEAILFVVPDGDPFDEAHEVAVRPEWVKEVFPKESATT